MTTESKNITNNELKFKPTEVWTMDPEFVMDESILEAVKEINQQDSRQVLRRLKKSVRRSEGGVAYAILDGPPNEQSGYSTQEAIVIFNQVAQDATPNMLAQAEFIRVAAKHANVRDSDGKLVPVAMIASPSITSRLRLSNEEIHRVINGDLGPAAAEFLKTVVAQEIGTVALNGVILRPVEESNYGIIRLAGFSQGAAMAANAAVIANKRNLDVKSLSIGDYPGVEDRSFNELREDLSKASLKDYKSIIGSSKIDLQKVAFGRGRKDIAWHGLSFLASPVANYALAKGMSADTFTDIITEILQTRDIDFSNKKPELAIGYGSDSAITKRVAIEQQLAKLNLAFGDSSFVSVMVEGANHAWGDNLLLLAKLYLQIFSK